MAKDQARASGPEDDGPKVTLITIQEDIVTATYWGTALSVLSRRLQRKANGWAYLAATLATITGAAVWAEITSSPKWYAQAAVILMAWASAIVGLVPRFNHYSETATTLSSIASKYNTIIGPLWETAREAHNPQFQRDAARVHAAFNDAETKKDDPSLVAILAKPREEVDNERDKLLIGVQSEIAGGVEPRTPLAVGLA